MHTKDMLADELMKLGLMDMSLKARGGYYHDFLSPLATPEIQLVNDLLSAAHKRPDRYDDIMILRARVIQGQFDASPEESAAWAESEEGQETFRKLIPGRDKPMTKHCRYAKSDMTPCVLRDGDICFALDANDDPMCVGCERSPKTLGVPPPRNWKQIVAEYKRQRRA